MKRQTRFHIVSLVAVVALAAVLSDRGLKESSSPDAPTATPRPLIEGDDSLSVWGLRIGMSSQEAASILKTDQVVTSGGYQYCSSCEPRDWTGERCLKHAGEPFQGAVRSDQIMVNYTDGRITYMTSPVLEVDGKTSLREGDSLKKVTAVFPKARIQMAEDGRNIAVLPGARTYIQFHEDRVVEFQINSRRFPSL